MKKTYKKFSAFLMVMVLFACTLSTTAFAADSTITYKGRTTGFVFAPGSEYTDTDLFENFKGVMPGDVRSEVVTVKNGYSGCDYIKVYMGAVLHNDLQDESGNPISPKVLAELQARKASSSNTAMSDLEYMHDFLSQMELTVWKGEKTDANIIYKGVPNSLYDGFDEGIVYLGKLGRNGSVTLNVELAVNIEMGNEYADRIGEVDWVFMAEEYNNSNDKPDDSNPGKDPTPGSGTTVTPDSPNPPMEQGGVQTDVITDVPKTGDDTVVWPYVTLLGVGIVGMVLTLFKKRKKDNH